MPMTRMPSSDFPVMKSGMACDLTESKDKNAYVAHFDTPGVPKDAIKISVEDDILTVAAHFKRESKSKEGEKIHWQERSSGEISRSIKLPEHVDQQSITARQSDGVLEVFIPKSNKVETKVQQITIN